MCGPKIYTLCHTSKHLLPNWSIRRAFPGNLAVDVAQLASRCFWVRHEKCNDLISKTIKRRLYKQYCRGRLFCGRLLCIYNIVIGTYFMTQTKKLPENGCYTK